MKVKVPPPDPMIGMAAQGSTRIAQQAENRAAESDKYYREVLAPRYLSQMDNQIAQGKELQDFSMGLARKNQGRLEDTTWKFQDQFYDDVNAYDDEATREQLAGAASADIQRSMDAGTGQMRRGLGLRGVNPNSGMSMMMERRNAMDGALAKAQAMTSVRDAARKEGMNLKAMAAGMGGSLGGSSQGWAGMAGTAAGMGMAGIQGAQGGLNSANSGWNSTMGLAGNQWGQLGQYGTNATNMRFDANKTNASQITSGIGTAVCVAAGMMIALRLKKDVSRNGTRSDGLGVYEFSYIWGGPRQVGVMADEVLKVYPGAVFAVNGFFAVDYSKLGA
jgi:hypothetical protein